jgi:hypothetical protein
MQLRTLQSIDDTGPTASNTVLIAIPIEIMELLQRAAKNVLRFFRWLPSWGSCSHSKPTWQPRQATEP